MNIHMHNLIKKFISTTISLQCMLNFLSTFIQQSNLPTILSFVTDSCVSIKWSTCLWHLGVNLVGFGNTEWYDCSHIPSICP